MEILMKEGAQVEEQISHSAEVMAQVNLSPIRTFCHHLSSLCSSGALWKSVSCTSSLPRRSWQILTFVLESNANSGDVEEAQRIGLLEITLSRNCGTSRGLQIDDKIVFPPRSLYVRAMHSGAASEHRVNW
jgi:hypothetical protein